MSRERKISPWIAAAVGPLALAFLPIRATGQEPAVAGPPLGVTGTIRHHHAFPSVHVAPRNVDVWLPPGYDANPDTRYPVLYVQDGQNAFDPTTSYGGVDWAIDEEMTRLISEGAIRPAIVVAIWNTPDRAIEYMPRKAVQGSGDTVSSGIPGIPGFARPLRSDAYLRFLVGELKPFIDATYRTRTGREDTFVMGSSMGALISAYAVAEYPDVFGGAACLSTHWPAGDGAVIDYLAHALPDPATHRFWFDHGSETLDASYAPYQERMDAVMSAGGYTRGENWVSRVYPGAEHSERAWRVRVHEPLVFLLGRSGRRPAPSSGER